MQISRRTVFAAAALSGAFLLSSCSGGADEATTKDTSGDAAADYLAYFGTYTGENSKGIYVYKFNSETGQLTEAGLAAETPSPSFLAVHPSEQYLYSVSEINDFDGKKTGAVSAFKIDKASGMLTLLNTVTSGGEGPCHLNVDQTGKCLVVANYGGGSVEAIPVLEDGRLGEPGTFIQHEGSSVNERRQAAPHAHSVNFSPDNRFVIAADLGLDKLLVYKVDPAAATLAPNMPPFATVKPGSGPRHFTFHPSGKYGYAINEIALTVTAFSYDAEKGAFAELQTLSTLPDAERGEGQSTAEIRAHPSGKFLYGSNRGHNTIAVFAVDPEKGTLTLVENVSTQGETPRNFNLDPTGKFLIAENQRSNNIVVYSIDQESGKLTPTGQTLNLGSPVCLRFVSLK
jgi:6-phosphogluconolactonase